MCCDLLHILFVKLYVSLSFFLDACLFCIYFQRWYLSSLCFVNKIGFQAVQGFSNDTDDLTTSAHELCSGTIRCFFLKRKLQRIALGKTYQLSSRTVARRGTEVSK